MTIRLSGNTILITGGASGIGLAFAERFMKLGNKVIVCGRREEKLKEVSEKFPELVTYPCDVSSENDRVQLLEKVKEEHPEVNILVNNAGIQQRFKIADANESWSYYQQELAANLEAPIHLSMLFVPFLQGKDNAAIINVTSGLAFTPMASAPIYSATKAGLHSFTMSLRYQLKTQGIQVIEVAPPAVNTDLGGAGLHTFGEPLNEFADGIFEGLQRGDVEIGYKSSAEALRLSRDEMDDRFEKMNARIF